MSKYSDVDEENKLRLFMDEEEEREYLEETYERVRQNPRFYLDNLPHLDMFRTRFKHDYPYDDYKTETLLYFFGMD
jgi:hypothetical protein